ncbi:hypothetical protein [uncultured Planktosalinus sp.]|uniref:hypothetical protein n=1 Tax=uncultured Planktosalinus sp. TaxID=1810935 RepID=UPI0030D8AC29|tara:strand:+ start:387 stop:893 length:507 start_codon:yes stop_codon:yes gene_type:complete
MNKNKIHIKKHGFRTPEGYFDNLEAELFATVTERSIMQEEIPFKVPENYFETLPKIIEAKTISQKKQSTVISLFSKKSMRYAVSIAAVFAVLFSVVIFQSNLILKPNESLSEVSYYIEDELVQYSDIELQELFSELSIDDETLNSSISDEEILDYLSYSLRDDHIFNE